MLLGLAHQPACPFFALLQYPEQEYPLPSPAEPRQEHPEGAPARLCIRQKRQDLALGALVQKVYRFAAFSLGLWHNRAARLVNR
jgi:hypothetical protein